MEPGFSPLGERLHLLPCALSPRLAELAVWCGMQLPFADAADLLTRCCGTTISGETVRRLTEQAGACWWQLELDLVQALETAALTPGAEPVVPPEAQPLATARPGQVSIDGAMIHVRGEGFREVRTLVVGEIAEQGDGVKATALSYLSALVNAETFSRVVLAELHRRNVLAHPEPIVAISDGAPWIQSLLDLQCPQAVRVLDIMHAITYLADAAKVAFGPGTETTSEWITRQRLALREGRHADLFAALATLPASEERDRAHTYLEERRAMLRYPQCAANGWPVGSGAVESANKLVVEARLKRSGMQWAAANVTPMVALRALHASGRWDAAWPRIVAAWRAERPRQAAARRTARRATMATPDIPLPAPAPPSPAPDAMVASPHRRAPTVVNGRPTATHPWNQPFLRPRPPRPPES